MHTQPSQLLLVHGMIVLLVGLLCGVPFWSTIVGKKSKAAIRAWRVAHTTLIACGLLMLLVNLLVVDLALSARLSTVLVWSFVLSGYSFVFALVIGALTGRRALTPAPVGSNTLLFAGHFAGAVGAILGSCLILYGLL